MTITRRPFFALPLGCIIAALSVALSTPASAGGDIVKCVAADGHVTLTDGPCDSGNASVIVPAAGGAAPSVAPRPGINRVALTATPVEHDNWVDPRPHGKMFARDAATLRAARTSLQVMDEAAGARSQRTAGLN